MDEKIERIRRSLRDAAPPPPRPPEKMTAEKVEFNFRIYWTKMTISWSAERRATVRQQANAIIQMGDFEDNLIEKRYHLGLEDVPEQMHSGASLLALVEVLNALDSME